MAIAKHGRGQNFVLDGEVWEFDKKFNNSDWQIKSKDTGQIKIQTKEEFADLYSNGRLRFVQYGYEPANDPVNNKPIDKSGLAIDMLPAKMKTEALIRYAYASTMDKEGLESFTKETLTPIIDEIFGRISETHKKPSHWTVYRWFKRYTEGGRDIRALVTRNGRKGNRKKRYQRQYYHFIEQAVNEIYLSGEKGTIQKTVDHATTLIESENRNLPESLHLPLPTESVVKTVINNIPAYDRVVARSGLAAAKRRFRTVLNSVVAEKPLDRVEIDHTVMDVLLLDDNLFPLGRPTLTICVDVKSRSILGIYIGFEPPSYLTVAQCLRHAFLPKAYLKEKYPSIVNEWIQHGVMDVLVVDNGLEFHSNNLESLCYPFGITIQYTPRKMPWFKGIVERLIGSMNRGVCHGVPGTTFESILEREDYDAAKNAVLTLESFRELVHVWIVDYYHQRLHKSLCDTPSNIWINNIRDFEIPLPGNVHDLDYLLGATVERTVSHIGVELNSLRYNSEELNGLRMRLGETFKATVRYNQADLGYIYVIDPATSEPLLVPAIIQEYANGLSEWQHKVCKRYAREHIDRKGIEALAKAKETIREIIARDLKDKRVKTRKRVHKFMSSADQNQPVNSIASSMGNKQNRKMNVECEYQQLAFEYEYRKDDKESEGEYGDTRFHNELNVDVCENDND